MKFIRKCKLFYLYDMKMEYKLLLSHLTLSVLAILLLTTLLYTNSAGILERKLLNSGRLGKNHFVPGKYHPEIR